MDLLFDDLPEVDLDSCASDEAASPVSDSDAAESADAGAPAAGPFDRIVEPLRSALKDRGFDELSAVQTAVLEVTGQGHDLQISSQTGSGKTVALGLVIADSLVGESTDEANWTRKAGPEALVIVPTRELANQVAEELGWLFAGLPRTQVVAVTGGTSVYGDRRTLERTPRVLVGTPGRLLDHVTSGNLDLSAVRELILDEADQMLDMGFRDELDGILAVTASERRTHLVSATFPDGIMRLAERYQGRPVAIEGTRLGDANQSIEHVGYLVDPRARYDLLVNLLLDSEADRTLVFVERRADAIEVADRLADDGFSALPLSGELAQSQRERTLAAFRSGDVAVLVATDVAARGLDVPDVGTVVHTSLPIGPQIYTHRSGRTGRAGKSGRSVLFAAPNRRRRASRLVADAGVDLTWERAPTAEDVRARVRAREQARQADRLAEALEAGVDPGHRAQAERLLKDRPAEDVVAALLGQLEPERRAEPREVGPAERDFPARRRGGREARGHDELRPQARRGPRRHEREGDRGRGRGMDRDAVRFFINSGRNQGANPSRLLAAICRRGEISGEHIGAIAIHPNASTFDVHSQVAERFEQLAGRRDQRDPQVFIRRDRGPVPQGER